MKPLSDQIRKMCAGIVALALGAMCLASPCRADEPAATHAVPHSLATISPATLAQLTADAHTQTQSEAPIEQHGAFFKSKRGAAILVLLGAGFGYTFYSKVHDRVLSAVR